MNIITFIKLKARRHLQAKNTIGVIKAIQEILGILRANGDADRADALKVEFDKVKLQAIQNIEQKQTLFADFLTKI